MKYRRILAIFLCLGMLLPGLPAASAVGEDDLTDSLDKQIRAFADSIDQSDAVDDAAKALAVHGMTKGGKKLSVGKSHALTATLMNSEMMLAGLTESCTSAILAMQQLDLTELNHVYGCGYWQGAGESYFYTRVYTTTGAKNVNLDWMLTDKWDRSGKRNAYDEALDWMAGFASLEMEFSRTKITADTMTYKVTLIVSDRFDFAISGNSFFKDLISGIGALLFKEFDWESKVSFTLTVPYECSHSSGRYHWTYDPQSHTLTSNSSDGFRLNEAYRQTYTNSEGTKTYYHELEEPVRLFHDEPWVMEFDTQNPGVFNMSPLDDTSVTHPFLKVHGRRYLAVGDRERIRLSGEEVEDNIAITSNIYHYYGTSLMDRFSFTTSKIYTIRLENQVSADGSNMIYVSVRDTDTGAVLLDRTPLDDYFKYDSQNGSEVLLSEADDWVSGKDLYISYIGNKSYRLDPKHFELWIWENGEDGESVSYYEKTSVTAPTCIGRGFTTYTCSACGNSKKADYVDALGHDYDAVVTDPTCIEAGYTTHICTACGDSYMDDYTDSVDHSYEDGVCIWCGAEETLVQWYSGSTSLNGTIDLNMYVILSENLVNDPETFVRFTFENREVDVPMADALVHPLKDGRVTYRFTCPLFAKQVADSVLVQVMRGETPVGEPKAYSAMQYCKNLINKNEDPEAVAMCKAMLNYAAAAQLLFNYNTENLANESLSEEDKNLPTVDVSAHKYTVINNEPGIRARGATMMMESEIRIRVYFELEEDRTIDAYTFTIDGVEVEPEQNDDGMWYIESAGIVAKGMEEMHEFKCGGITVTYGALSYVNSKLTDDDPLTVNLAKALYAYYIAAENLLG